MGTVCHWQPFWSTTRVRYIGQCWYFKLQWTTGQVRIKASCVTDSIIHWENCAVTMYRHMNQGFWRGLGGEGDPFWLHRETLTLKGPSAYQNTAIFQKGVNTKFLQTSTHYATPLWVVRRQRVNISHRSPPIRHHAGVYGKLSSITFWELFHSYTSSDIQHFLQ